MKWITRARPKTDRIACPWLITKFIDPAAEILYIPAADTRRSASTGPCPKPTSTTSTCRPPAPSRPASPAQPANKARGTARHPASRSAAPNPDVRPREPAVRPWSTPRHPGLPSQPGPARVVQVRLPASGTSLASAVATWRPSSSASRTGRSGSTQPSISIRRVRPVHRARA